MGKSPKLPPFQSSLEKHPEYVRAIGMISIETTSLDIMLGDLLAATLGIPESIGHAIYLTPRSATARIELFQNVTKYAFPLVPIILMRTATRNSGSFTRPLMQGETTTESGWKLSLNEQWLLPISAIRSCMTLGGYLSPQKRFPPALYQ
jgi:hypothetical protein